MVSAVQELLTKPEKAVLIKHSGEETGVVCWTVQAQNKETYREIRLPARQEDTSESH